jgi:hypothetical protein
MKVLDGFGIAAGILAVIGLYWVPTIVAWRRRVANLGSIAVINFFGFALGVGWIVALAMAVRDVLADRRMPPGDGAAVPPPGRLPRITPGFEHLAAEPKRKDRGHG